MVDATVCFTRKALVPLHVAKGLWRMNRVEIVVINSDCSGSLPTGALRLFTPVESPEIKYLWQRANRRVPPIRGPLPVARIRGEAQKRLKMRTAGRACESLEL